MADAPLLHHVSRLLDREGPAQGAFAHAPSGLHLLRHPAPTGQDASVYRPLLCLVLQGAKEVGTSRRTLRVADGQSLVVSHALPVVSRITEATPDRPYVALVFPIVCVCKISKVCVPPGLEQCAELRPALGDAGTENFRSRKHVY